ncbi:MAG: molybdopterin-binding protein [bacterium]|nr:molybdopterin-binding protein [bacterium]
MGTIHAICISDIRGIQKSEVSSIELRPNHGLVGDAHAGNWHRQVSLLSYEKIQAFREKGADVAFGAFGENLVVEGFDFASLPIGSLFRCGKVLLELSQIGKECHSHCAIYQVMGDCIMPREGVFARVLEGGTLRVGDELLLEERQTPLPFQAAVITLSDKGAAGERKDESGPLIASRLRAEGYEVVEELLLPDNAALLKKHLIRLADQRQLDLILTTGGTGFAPTDVTPEATLAVADRLAPGISEAIRAASLAITPRAMLSRGVSVIRKKSLIVNLAGSPKAVSESMDVFLSVLPHALELLRGQKADCARKDLTASTTHSNFLKKGYL